MKRRFPLIAKFLCGVTSLPQRPAPRENMGTDVEDGQEYRPQTLLGVNEAPDISKAASARS